MKKLLIFTLLLTITMTFYHPQDTRASSVGLPSYNIEAVTPRYIYRTDVLGRTNSIILEVEHEEGLDDITDLYNVKIFDRNGDFLRYLEPPRPVTITSTTQTVEFSLSSLSLELGELVFYEIDVDYSTVMRGAIMEYPEHQPSGLYTEFDYYMYNDVPLTRYSQDHHNDDLMIIHYRINTIGTDATERVNKIRIFDFVSATPLVEYTRGMLYDIQGHNENYDATSDVLKGDVTFMVLSSDYNELLDNPLKPYGSSALTYPNPNGLDELQNTHLNAILMKQIPSVELYSSDSTRFYSPNPFVFSISPSVFLGGKITLNALPSSDFSTDYIETTDIKDNSQPLSVPSEFYNEDILYTYEVSETLEEGDTVGVTWTLTTAYGDEVEIFDTYTVDGSSDTIARFLDFLDYYGLSNNTGKIFVSLVLLVIVNIIITLIARVLIVYAISNMAVISLLSFAGFIPEYMMAISAFIIAMMFIRVLMRGGTEYE